MYNKAMSKSFKHAVTILSKKLSLKEKQKALNCTTKVERPLSRNVRFFDLSTTQGVTSRLGANPVAESSQF